MTARRASGQVGAERRQEGGQVCVASPRTAADFHQNRSRVGAAPFRGRLRPGIGEEAEKIARDLVMCARQQVLAQVEQELQGVGPARYEVAAIDAPAEPHPIYYSPPPVPPPLQ